MAWLQAFAQYQACAGQNPVRCAWHRAHLANTPGAERLRCWPKQHLHQPAAAQSPALRSGQPLIDTGSRSHSTDKTTDPVRKHTGDVVVRTDEMAAAERCSRNVVGFAHLREPV